MTTAVPVIETGWIADPLVERVGAKTVAIVLVLAARVAVQVEADAAVVIAADVWSYYLDGIDTDRATSAGLVVPLQVGARAVGYRVSTWVLARVDNHDAIADRVATRDRVRRLRRRRANAGQLDLWNDVDPRDRGESGNTPSVSHFDGRVGLCKKCGEPHSVTSDVTLSNSGPSLTARAEVRTTSTSRSGTSRSSQIVDRLQATGGDATVSSATRFRLVLAIVANVRRERTTWREPSSTVHRRELVDAVRSTVERAHLRDVTDADIRRAIRRVEADDAVRSRSAGR